MSAPVCLYCEDPIEPGDRSEPIFFGLRSPQMRFVHAECMAHQVIGGVNHLRKVCTCCGGTQPPDPPGLTRREAALAALQCWREMT